MPVIYLDGVLDREAVVTRGKAFTAEVRGLSAVPATVSIRVAGVEVGKATDSATVACQAPADLPLGGAGIAARCVSTAGTGSTYQRSTTVVADPQPGPGNTGFAGDEADLDPHPGGWITTDTQLAGRLITGPLVAKAELELVDCVERSGEVSGGRTVNVDSAAGGALIARNSTFDGVGRSVLGLGYNRITLLGCDVHSFSDGIRANTDVLIEDTWIHGLVRQGSLHPDCVQSTGGRRITVRHSTLDCTGTRPDGIFDLGNACVQLGNENLDRNPASVLTDVLVEDCWLDGGNYTINVRDDPGMDRITVRGNRFGPRHRYGHFARYGTQPADDACTGNVDADGRPVTARQL